MTEEEKCKFVDICSRQEKKKEKVRERQACTQICSSRGLGDTKLQQGIIENRNNSYHQVLEP
eukprot:scaffold159482_cov12-Tisochrysis_lutea.AAC.1